jgi:hypothetical protein
MAVNCRLRSSGCGSCGLVDCTGKGSYKITWHNNAEHNTAHIITVHCVSFQGSVHFIVMPSISLAELFFSVCFPIIHLESETSTHTL